MPLSKTGSKTTPETRPKTRGKSSTWGHYSGTRVKNPGTNSSGDSPVSQPNFQDLTEHLMAEDSRKREDRGQRKNNRRISNRLNTNVPNQYP